MLSKIIQACIGHRWLVMFAVAASGGAGRSQLRRSCRSTRCPTSPTSRCRSTPPPPAIRRWKPSSASPSRWRPRWPACRRLEQTRSLSRYGLSQVTVVFKDGTDIYFARQLVSRAHAGRARPNCPPASTPTMGPIATGLGEIYLWTVDADAGARKPDGTPYTPTDLREIQDWIIKPQLRNVPGVTEVNFHRRLRQGVPGRARRPPSWRPTA